MQEEELRGKVALVTGSSQGIGRGVALELARAGCDVVLTGRGSAKLKAVAAEIEALGRKPAIHATDLRHRPSPPDWWPLWSAPLGGSTSWCATLGRRGAAISSP